MQILLSIYLFTVPVLLGLLMLWQHSRGTVPLISLRNFSLIGLIVFQYFSGGLHLATNNYMGFPVADPERSGLIYTLILSAFTVLYLIMYHFGWPARQLSRAVPITRSVPNDATLLVLAVVLLPIGVALRFVPVPLIGTILGYFGYGLIATAAGFAGWTLMRHFFNPIYVIACSAIFMVASVASIIGVFGRRGLVAAAAGFVWGAFYSKLRFVKARWVVVALLILAGPGIYLTAAFTASRSVSDSRSTVGTLLRGMANPRFRETIPALLSGQSCGPISFFVIENYPRVYQANFLGSVTYIFLSPIPRSWWPDKPTPISTEIASNSRLSGVNRRGITLPPGVAGYIAAEGGIPALFVYAWFFGCVVRFFDELVRRAWWNPLLIVPVGSALGQILGLFRGDMAIFTFAYVMSFTGSYAACVFIGRIVDRAVGSSLPMDDPAETGMLTNGESPWTNAPRLLGYEGPDGEWVSEETESVVYGDAIDAADYSGERE
jgi:hypothetical protein